VLTPLSDVLQLIQLALYGASLVLLVAALRLMLLEHTIANGRTLDDLTVK
jgi:hypothetical protein